MRDEESDRGSTEIKQNSGKRQMSKTAMCDRGWLERLEDRVVSAAGGGGLPAFDVGSTDQRQHQQRLQKNCRLQGGQIEARVYICLWAVTVNHSEHSVIQ